MRYQTFSDLVNEIDTGGSWATGNINANDSPKFAEFYAYWGNYLEPTPAFLTYLMAIPGGIAKALYQITVTLEHVFNNTFKLFGLFGYLGDTNTVIGNFFYWFQVLGTALFTLILVVSAITGVFTKPIKYKGVITNFLLVTLVTAVLPFALTNISTAIAQDAMAIQTSSSDDSSTYSSLAIQPMKNNVVDLKVLLENDFDQSLFPLDDYGYIKPVQTGSTAVNNITDATDKRDTADFATKIDFSANFGASNTEQLNDLEDLYPGVKGLFLHKLNSSQDGVATITTHKIVDGLNAFESVYLRYKVNWIGMFLQYGILIVLLFSMALKLVKSIFDIVVEALVSPLVGYSSLSSSKKYKELLRTIGGAFAGIIFEVVIMRVTLEICRDLPTLSVSAVTKLSGGFFDGLNMWEQCLASMLVYLGVFLAAMQGVAMIERWLGVSTGHSDTAQQLIGAMMAGNAFAQGAGALATGAVGAAQVGANVASKVPGAVATGSKLIGNSLAATGGGIKGAINAAKDQGVANAAKGGVSNMVNLADAMGKEVVGKAKDYAGGVMDNLDSKAQAGHDAVYEALKNDAVTDKPGFESYLNPQPDEYGLNPSGTYGGEPLFPEEDTSGTSTMSGGISDPTIQTEPEGEAFNGVSDQTAGNSSSPSQSPAQPRLDNKSSKPNSSDNTPPKPTSSSSPSASQRLSQSRQQMKSASQALNQAGQHMQGQNHIRGAEIDESEE
ncbi:hypothetical protein M0P28_09465 [Streptococcus pasteurianus]|uniref:pLS20_p028 family conjugation system transmembrane protein n=1 Tax=Streptococcus pasteurianus TaxID=197614 RepID=UPI0020BDB21D|nr:hypothetical protein [Streptococcus pasteurianus]MDV5117062.1 hypothetical protein [Streptococcus pasteurianus]MDV5154904.1 hypothetical protein [Streptococcus pasteurianus]MDV5163665.1 hypothetical protein [Streptococcus pasteurianus]WCQ72039.1 hypothetical protein M0P28_09465 [Streptococcus pasteurianus]